LLTEIFRKKITVIQLLSIFSAKNIFFIVVIPTWFKISKICKESRWVIIKQWQLAREFEDFDYTPKTCRFWRVFKFAEARDPPNVCDSHRQIWRVLSKFGKFDGFGEFGKIWEGRLDLFMPKNIFFVHKTT
jgi:hypothetical protein